MFKINTKNLAKNSAKMSLYSIFSIIAIIILCAAAWNMLDLAKNTYLKTNKSSGKTTPKEAQPLVKKSNINPFFRKLLIAFHLAKANLKNTRDKVELKENEIKAQNN